MKELRDAYISIQTALFPVLDEEFGEITEKMKKFLRIPELLRSNCFLTGTLR